MRFSIGKLMLLVAICAINFVVMRKIGSDPSGYGVAPWFGELILLGGLPMLDVLAVAALFRHPGRPSIDRFLPAGFVALLLYLAIASVAAKPIRDLLIGIVSLLIPLGNRTWPILIGRITLAVLMNLGPQLALAGLLAGWLRGPRDRDAAPPPADIPPQA